jgi:hypothetical protein
MMQRTSRPSDQTTHSAAEFAAKDADRTAPTTNGVGMTPPSQNEGEAHTLLDHLVHLSHYAPYVGFVPTRVEVRYYLDLQRQLGVANSELAEVKAERNALLEERDQLVRTLRAVQDLSRSAADRSTADL